MKRFDNRTVIVTGGGGGIGGATCKRFGAEGARVAVFDLNLDAAEQVAAAVRAACTSLWKRAALWASSARAIIFRWCKAARSTSSSQAASGSRR